MPPLAGFSDNPLITRNDFIRAGVALLKPLEAYKSPGEARVKLPTATGTGFSEVAAQLEGFARPLWLVGPLLKSSESQGIPEINLRSWVTGLKNGTDPTSTEYWGDLGDFDQRMVEMESIAYALLLKPDTFTNAYDQTAQANLVAWLKQINSKTMSQNNWRWFRVFVNLALIKSLGVPGEEVNDIIKSDLKILDNFYLGDGWSSDGLWCDERKQVDYYSGSFAIQFAQLLFIKFAPGFDPKRTERYKIQARQFASGFWRYFDAQGAATPFGRSLTYRFAFSAFWGAVAFADVQLDTPLDNPGVVKGLLLRHLRWWSSKTDIFNLDGSLNIGFTYPNMYIAEDYNSPQSVYWCLKSFIAVTISEDNPFWRMEELPHPIGSSPRPDGLLLLHQPRHIMCNTPEHHFLLSSGQATKRNHKGREAKYGKFAYSSAFGFSVPVGTSLDQIAPDSTLAISIDGGESWKTCSDLHDLQSRDMKFAGEVVPTLLGTWRPFTFSDFEVRTTLVPPVRKYPGWHLRIHEVRWSKPPVQNIQMASGGFAVSAETSDGRCIYEEACVNAIDEASVSGKEGWWACDETSLVISESGACGAIQLTAQFLDQQNDIAECQLQGGKGIVIKPHANTNLMAQRTLIPAISTRMDLHSRPSAEGSEKESAWNSPRIFVTAVFGVDRNAGHPTACVWNMWRLHPVGRLVRQADGSLAFLD